MASEASRLDESAAVTLLTAPIRPRMPTAAETTSYRLAASVTASEALYHMATRERVRTRIWPSRNTAMQVPRPVAAQM